METLVNLATDSMNYLDSMEIIQSDIMEKVISQTRKYDYAKFEASDVQRALTKDVLTQNDFAALLSPAADNALEKMAVRSKLETRKHFGNSVALFTPLYLSNYCSNDCVYCGFNRNNKISRAKLSFTEIDKELHAIAKTGLSEILLLTGESRTQADVEYIGEAVKLSGKYFSTIGIEIYPLNSEEYAYLHRCGVDFVSVYQETYDPVLYERKHPSGPKRVYPYRFHAQERALSGGMRGVSFGALLGLGDFRKDVFATGLHAHYVQQKYPHAEISFSVPRIRPYINNDEMNPHEVREKHLLQVMLALRIFMPFAGMTISTRERAGFRDHSIGIAATKISAGVKVGIGGHDEVKKGDEQFEISDPRDVSQIHTMILEKGLQPVYTDYIRLD